MDEGRTEGAPAEDEEADGLEGDEEEEPPEAALGFEGFGRVFEDFDVVLVDGEEGAVGDEVYVVDLVSMSGASS